jgi:glycosyltransferase involved in cell wall biosynthesis
VGGTNPSLLEAMASSAFIIANDNPFNKDVLGENACYFSSSADISQLLNNSAEIESNRQYFISNNLMKIESAFNWKFIAAEYEKLCQEACSKVQGRKNRPE